MAYPFKELPSNISEKSQIAMDDWHRQAANLRAVLERGYLLPDHKILKPSQIARRKEELARLQICIGTGSSRRYEQRGETMSGVLVFGRVRNETPLAS